MIESWGVSGFNEQEEKIFDEVLQTDESSSIDFTGEVEEETYEIPSMPNLDD